MSDFGNSRFRQKLDGGSLVGGDYGFGGVPVEVREVGVISILGMS